MMLCAMDCEAYVELSSDERTTLGTIICRECGVLVRPGAPFYEYQFWSTDEDGDEIRGGKISVCESCGGAIDSYLSAGYCWTPGYLRAMINEKRDEDQ